MEKLEYKGYLGSVEFSKEDNCLFGKVLGLNKELCITYIGNTKEELFDDFKSAIEHYLEYCQNKGIKPKKSFIGKLNIRIPTDVHCRLALYAENQGISINSLVRDSIEKQLVTYA
ncbi:MAG: type II toxin-antitoxin system HicB family antitoxin [Marinilabiliaceae bacterium]|nr:type II toxin-antitoxin system HicB family antitoxin [Marinilabiliaceae bacterium]